MSHTTQSATTTSVHVVQTFLDAVLSGDMDTVFSLIDDKAQIIGARTGTPEPGSFYGEFSGKDGAKEFFNRFGNLLEPGEFNIVGRFGQGEHAAFYGNLSHTVRKNGNPFVSQWALIAKVSNGKLDLYHFLEDTAALEAASR